MVIFRCTNSFILSRNHKFLSQFSDEITFESIALCNHSNFENVVIFTKDINPYKAIYTNRNNLQYVTQPLVLK
jgi:hypothetical protein